MKHWITTTASASAIALMLAMPAMAQETIKLSNVGELSGGGATVGTNFKNGADLAVAEINAKGGILGKKIEITHADTQSNPGVARGLIQKAIDDKPYAILGPGFSGSVKVTAQLTSEAGIAQVMGGEAAELTQMGMKTLFRTSFGQQSSMPKISAYLANEVKAKNVALVWVNNDFGKGGRDVISKDLKARGVNIVADLSTEAGQVDFAADAAKVKAANADAVFVYLNEEESARILKELRKADIKVPLIGETTLLGQKVIDLAGDAANGVRGHVGLTVEAPVPALQEYKAKFQSKYNYVPDHNGIKGYLAVYMIKAATEKMGKIDSKGLPDVLKDLTILASKEPGIMLDLTIDKNGDLDRDSFLGEVIDGKQKITRVLPKLNK
jgi:branched-chain amino acid transport system substrate-binding protein